MKIRTSIISPSSMYTSEFYNEAKYCGKTGYFKGRYKNGYQCVNYAIARTCEISNGAVCYYKNVGTTIDDVLNKNPLFKVSGYGNACNFIANANWEVGKEPKQGAIMVYGTSWGSGCGHVRIVEQVLDDSLVISGANENNDMAFKTIKKPTISQTGFLGYIYNPYVKEEDMNLVKIVKDKDYDYKWSVDGNAYGLAYDVTTEGGFSDESLEKDGWEQVLKVNGSLFYEYNKAHYACGLEKAFGKNHQDVSMTAVSDYNNCMAVACVDDELWFASQKWIIDNKLSQAYGAITGMGLLMAGKKVDMHKGFESQWNAISGRTVIGEDKDGNILSYSFAGTTGQSGMTGSQLQTECLNLGFYNAILFDGGGSVFRVYPNANISTTRKVKNALMLYRKKKATNTSQNSNETSIDYKSLYEAQIKENEALKSNIEQLEANIKEMQADIDDKTNKLAKIKEVINE